MNLAVVILAAGRGTRMKSRLPKVLHPLAGRPMVLYVVHTASALTTIPPILVVGHGADAVRQVVGERARYVIQEPQLGTGHAVQQARPAVDPEVDTLLVTYADMPLLTPEALRKLVEVHQDRQATVTLLTVERDDPRGFGRVVRDGEGRIQAIVEQLDATPEQAVIRELNTGTYCFDTAWLWEHLPHLRQNPVKGEYYLTDLIAMAVAEGRRVEAVPLEDPTEALGINTRLHLAEAEAALRRRINERWMLAGVTMVDPTTTYIEADVVIGPDTVIYPHTHLQGKTRIGAECRLGPNAIIRDSTLGDRCIVLASVLEGATLEEGVDVGPFSHLRKGAHLARGVHMGNFGEVKNSYLGPGTKMGHFSYVGDATIGANVNIGAGAITCNYDGERKHPTIIEDDVFIGSDTMLVAPVRVGKRARTGAGAVVTHDIPPGSLAYGVPARVRRSVEGAGAPGSEEDRGS
ncbi:MAG: UDP-N-acetylglucosamine diphosphorylase/glucosamine-1-phosphate N-acetyltransferase [Chloroflexi bacterium]|nr:MAG: UDP-N-acetylglucosamine diphosphorylase/glucosamine-1-phosphate N-acetyltransferase [Chloroflexota bacterium]